MPLTSQERAAYRLKRREGLSAALAFYHATKDKGGADVPCENGEAFEREGFALTVSIEPDTWGDLEMLGSYTSDPRGALDREAEGYPVGRNCHPYFLPAFPEMDRRESLEALARAEAFEAGEWQMLIVSVIASKAGIVLGTASVSGMESDGGERYLRDAIDDLATEAVADALASLEALQC